MIRLILIGVSFVSLFWFPYPYTLVLSFIASAFFPPWALFIGFFADVLYLPNGAWPTALVMGALLSLISVFVHRFIKTRIINQ
jgi:hypothetical protein